MRDLNKYEMNERRDQGLWIIERSAGQVTSSQHRPKVEWKCRRGLETGQQREGSPRGASECWSSFPGTSIQLIHPSLFQQPLRSSKVPLVLRSDCDKSLTVDHGILQIVGRICWLPGGIRCRVAVGLGGESVAKSERND